MIKKLFTILLVAAASVNAWGATGYTVTHEPAGKCVILSADGKNNHKFSTVNWWGQYYGYVKLKMIGEFNDNEMRKLCNPESGIHSANNTIITLDLSEASGFSASTTITDSIIKYVVLPNGWTKDSVNTFAANNTDIESCASISSDDTTTTYTYTDPKTGKTATYSYRNVYEYNGKKYCMPYTSYDVDLNFVSSWYEKEDGSVYDGELFTSNGALYGSDKSTSQLSQLSAPYSDNDRYTSNGKIYSGTLYTKSGSTVVCGMSGTEKQLTAVSNGYTYTDDAGKLHVVANDYKGYTIDGSTFYYADGGMYSINRKYMLKNDPTQNSYTINCSDVSAITPTSEATLNSPYGSSFPKGWSTCSITAWNLTWTAYNVYLLEYYDVNNEHVHYNGEQLYKNGNKHYYSGAYCPGADTKLYELSEINGQTYYLLGDDIYTGDVYKKSGDSTPYALSGEELSLETVLGYSSTNHTNETLYYGATYVNNNNNYVDVTGEDFYKVNSKYKYTYTDLMGVSHDYECASAAESISLSGNELYVLLTETTTTTSSDDLTLTAYVNTPGTLACTLQHMSQLQTSNYNSSYNPWYGSGKGAYAYKCLNVKKAIISGNIKALDLNCGGTVLDSNGHYTATNPTRGDGALFTNNSAAIKYIDLSDAKFIEDETYYPGDMTIVSLLNCTSTLETVLLPTDASQTEIPANCLNTCGKVKELCIPANYKKIGAYAFQYAGIGHFYTTSYNGSEVSGISTGQIIDYGDYAWTLSSNLKEIEVGAFNTAAVDNVKDLYCLAKVAPKCRRDAFSTKMYFGNNAHDSKIVTVNRLNYRPSYYSTVLHYPNDISASEKANYSDTTRVYSLSDETIDTDGNGDPFVWPTMAQYNRSFYQALAGETWNAWIPYAADGKTTYTYTGDFGGDTKEKIIAAVKAANAMADETLTYNDGTVNANDMGYVGWHQFVLVDDTFSSTEKPGEEKTPVWNFGRFKRSDWYTICVPFNMTKSDMLNIFGDSVSVYPEVRELEYVTRSMGNVNAITMNTRRILDENGTVYGKLKIGSDGAVVMARDDNEFKTVTENCSKVDGEDVIIEEGKPYYIRPHYMEGVYFTSAGNRALSVSQYKPDGTVHKPVANIHVNVLNEDHTKYVDWQDKEQASLPSFPYRYYFVGNYVKGEKIPVNCYFIAKSKRTGGSCTFRNTDSTREWPVYSAIIGAVASTNSNIKQVGGERTFETQTNYVVEFNPEDDFVFQNGLSGSSQAKPSFNVIFDDDEDAAGIALPNDDGSFSIIPSNSHVYNANGLYVGDSLNNLSKGVYIVAGKKYVVK